jgi:hypothetical protein
MLIDGFPDCGFDVFMGEPDSKRARKELKQRDRKQPTTSAPKRGEYRCGKCGFFPKKQKHTCATDKQKKGGPAKPAMQSEFAALNMLGNNVYY